MNVKECNDMQWNNADAYTKVSKTSMTEATKYIDKDNMQEGEPEDSVANSTVSCDGICQIRGHSCLNGAVAVIVTVSCQNIVIPAILGNI